METLEAARRQFAVTGHSIYLDLANQNSTPKCVLDELVRFHTEAHRRGADKQGYIDRIETVRGQLAGLLHCDRSEIALTKNTSEGLNIAAAGIRCRPGDNVVLSQFEHPNNVYPWLALARQGVEARIVRPAGRVVQAGDLIAQIDERTRAVTCSLVSFMPGERLDLAAVSAACHAHGAYLVVDAVQGLGIVDLDPHALGIDLLAASGHKGLLAPHGVGVLYCRREVCPEIEPAFVARAGMRRLRPMEHDSTQYEYAPLDDARRFEIGNFNYSGFSALGAALELILSLGLARIERHVLGLSGRLIDGLLEMGRVDVWTPREPARRAGIVGFVPPGAERVGAALRAAGGVFTIRREAIRFGFGFYNTADEVETVLRVIREAIA
ncbi:MAG: aminotransferase class V-fold PLP-dependent enzyme [Bacillota bacterium]|nr:aminotransferase class V-fold PLP-dependent enzyme [Bacillota bacterium]